MDNQSIARRVTKRRRANSSAAVQNKSSRRKMVIIFDDTWLEALKHLTCPQWSNMSFVCHHINGIVQRNLSRLPRQVIERIDLNSQYLSFNPRFTSVASSLQKLFHPTSYIKNVTMRTVNQKLIDAYFHGEERYICCQNFELLPFSDISSTPQKITQSLEWLARNVRSNSISLPERMFNRIHNTVKDFFALPVVRGTIPMVVINRYPDQGLYVPTNFGENLIGREVDSQGADALYEIENGDKRIRISLFRGYWYVKAHLKFYTI